MNEKRKHPRVKQVEGMAARVISDGPTDDELIIMRLTKDVSKFGLRFQTDKPLSVGTELKLYVALKSPRKTITHKARVAWVKRLEEQQVYNIGVELVDASEEDVKDWDAYISGRVQPGP